MTIYDCLGGPVVVESVSRVRRRTSHTRLLRDGYADEVVCYWSSEVTLADSDVPVGGLSSRPCLMV